MNVGSTYYLFKKDIRPEWEDENNKNGGKWQFTFRIQQKDLFDKSWLNTVMACIGETLEYSEDVCGVVASVKKNEYRMAIWTKTCENEEMCLSIG
jgi:translation initiation factor 4E